ncbi:MAG TPA: type II toxin-antitoxin system prevent-host-death family antitoxin [Terriglobia bacterium]|nr:type II toxin-antitoxin system prevent-host-death family antitoxin [Terriglobia bacterium]
MEEIAISKFKATCLGVLERVRKSKTPVRITRRGKPIAEIVPPTPENSHDGFGSMAGSFAIDGDIVSPVIDLNDFEALRD